MEIHHTNIGTEFEKFNIYLYTEDYIKLFNEEIAFGKLLKIFAGLGEIISRDPDKLRQWVNNVMNNYSNVYDVARNIVYILNKENNNE